MRLLSRERRGDVLHRECSAQLLPASDEVRAAMREVAAPSGADIADHAAQVLAERLQGRDGNRRQQGDARA